MNEILAAILGALLGGGLQIVQTFLDTEDRKKSITIAIGCEIDAILRIIEHKKYLQGIDQAIETCHSGTAISIIVDVSENYFHIFEGLGEKIGYLDTDFVSKTVNFYSYCKSIIDSTRAGGVSERISNPREALENLTQLRDLLVAAVSLGEQIVQIAGVRKKQLELIK